MGKQSPERMLVAIVCSTRRRSIEDYVKHLSDLPLNPSIPFPVALDPPGPNPAERGEGDAPSPLLE